MSRVGVEPTTTWLKVRCSTDWASGSQEEIIYLTNETLSMFFYTLHFLSAPANDISRKSREYFLNFIRPYSAWQQLLPVYKTATFPHLKAGNMLLLHPLAIIIFYTIIERGLSFEHFCIAFINLIMLCSPQLQAWTAVLNQKISRIYLFLLINYLSHAIIL